MDILFLLVPLSVVLVFAVIAMFAWALRSGQFDDVEREGLRILQHDETPASASHFLRGTDTPGPAVAPAHGLPPVDHDQVGVLPADKESAPTSASRT
jgi:cbb3-type cytochrome oxidase maturation protein